MRMAVMGSSRKQKGLAALETTLILPLLFLFFALTAEFGKIYYDYLTLTKQQRLASRYLAGNLPYGIDGIIDLTVGDRPTLVAQAKNLVVYDALVSSGKPLFTGMTVNDVQITAAADNHIQISTDYKIVPLFSSLLPDLASIFGGNGAPLNITLATSSVMRIGTKSS